jgi:hypothetical protein
MKNDRGNQRLCLNLKPVKKNTCLGYGFVLNISWVLKMIELGMILTIHYQGVEHYTEWGMVYWL